MADGKHTIVPDHHWPFEPEDLRVDNYRGPGKGVNKNNGCNNFATPLAEAVNADEPKMPELPLWHHNEHSKEMHPDPCGEWVRADTARFAILTTVLADRRARQSTPAERDAIRAAALQEAVKACFDHAELTRGVYRNACLNCASEIAELQTHPSASPTAPSASFDSAMDTGIIPALKGGSNG